MNEISISTHTYKNKALSLGIGLLTSLSVLGISNLAHGAVLGFQDAYAPVNWTLTLDNSDGGVNTTNAPNSISITSGDNGSGSLGNTDYTISAVSDGTVSFDWSYNTNDSDGPFYDPFGYLLNGIFVQLTNNGGTNTQNGTVSFNVLAGDIFGFRANTVDNIFGAATTTISNFSAPSVSEPSFVLGIIGVGVLGAVAKRKKQNEQ